MSNGHLRFRKKWNIIYSPLDSHFSCSRPTFTSGSLVNNTRRAPAPQRSIWLHSSPFSRPREVIFRSFYSSFFFNTCTYLPVSTYFFYFLFLSRSIIALARLHTFFSVLKKSRLHLTDRANKIENFDECAHSVSSPSSKLVILQILRWKCFACLNLRHW